MLDPREILRVRQSENAPAVPLAGTRAERMQRLQVGLIGLVLMILLIGLADAITNRVQQTEDVTVPEAAPTVQASESSAPRDPLADAGVVPELPSEPTPTASTAPNQQPTEDLPPPTTNAPLQ